MKKDQWWRLFFYVSFIIIAFTACKSKDKKVITGDEQKKTVVITDLPEQQTKRAPIINILDTVSIKRIVLCIKDSAKTSERVGVKLAEIYGVKLADAIKKSGLKSMSAPMAWYKNQKEPLFFEAGIPVNKRPAKLPKGVFIKETGGDSVIVAHFYGPYNLTPQCYESVKDILKDRKKKASAPPYEIYVDDPLDQKGKPKDPYKVQTDIVFPWR